MMFRLKCIDMEADLQKQLQGGRPGAYEEYSQFLETHGDYNLTRIEQKYLEKLGRLVDLRFSMPR